MSIYIFSDDMFKCLIFVHVMLCLYANSWLDIGMNILLWLWKNWYWCCYGLWAWLCPMTIEMNVIYGILEGIYMFIHQLKIFNISGDALMWHKWLYSINIAVWCGGKYFLFYDWVVKRVIESPYINFLSTGLTVFYDNMLWQWFSQRFSLAVISEKVISRNVSCFSITFLNNSSMLNYHYHP